MHTCCVHRRWPIWAGLFRELLWINVMFIEILRRWTLKSAGCEKRGHREGSGEARVERWRKKVSEYLLRSTLFDFNSQLVQLHACSSFYSSWRAAASQRSLLGFPRFRDEASQQLTNQPWIGEQRYTVLRFIHRRARASTNIFKHYPETNQPGNSRLNSLVNSEIAFRLLFHERFKFFTFPKVPLWNFRIILRRCPDVGTITRII